MSKGTYKVQNMNNDKSLIWKELKKTTVLKTVVLNLMKTESLSPQGAIKEFVVMDAPDWAIVIPVVDNFFLMVKQWRHGEKALSIEFPGGVIEKNETSEEGAKRELKEETGYSAGKLVHLGSINPNPALMTNHVHIYAAFDLHNFEKQNLDSDEYVNFLKIPQKEVFTKIGSSEYPHALMATALMLYEQYKNK